MKLPFEFSLASTGILPNLLNQLTTYFTPSPPSQQQTLSSSYLLHHLVSLPDILKLAEDLIETECKYFLNPARLVDVLEYRKSRQSRKSSIVDVEIVNVVGRVRQLVLDG